MQTRKLGLTNLDIPVIGLGAMFIGAPVSAFRAARYNQDSDILPSMIDDVLRRMFASLPAAL